MNTCSLHLREGPSGIFGRISDASTGPDAVWPSNFLSTMRASALTSERYRRVSSSFSRPSLVYCKALVLGHPMKGNKGSHVRCTRSVIPKAQTSHSRPKVFWRLSICCLPSMSMCTTEGPSENRTNQLGTSAMAGDPRAITIRLVSLFVPTATIHNTQYPKMPLTIFETIHTMRA